MKRNIIYYPVILIAILSGKIGYSQPGSAYIFFKPVYAFPANSSKIDENTATVQGVTYSKGVYGSYGRGLCLQAGFGKMINTNFGVELGGEWVRGKRINTSLNSDDGDLKGDANAYVRAVMIKPMFVLRNSGDLLSFYSKLGLAIAAYSKAYSTFDISGNINNQPFQLITAETDNIKGKVGFTAAFGLSFRISQSVALTTELNGQMISLPVNNGHYTEYKVNGQDQLSSLSASERTWVYEKSTSTAPSDPDKPGVKLYEPINFSYVGIAVGVKYYL